MHLAQGNGLTQSTPRCCCVQPTVKLLIDGQFKDSTSKEWLDVVNPVSGVHVTSSLSDIRDACNCSMQRAT